MMRERRHHHRSNSTAYQTPGISLTDIHPWLITSPTQNNLKANNGSLKILIIPE